VIDGVFIKIEPQLTQIFQAAVVIIQWKPFLIQCRWLHFPFPPADIMLLSCQYNGRVWLGPGKVFVPPMGREKSGHARVIDLQGQHQP
jgi:hypothetical protein